MALTLDRREVALSEALGTLMQHKMEELPVGDVRCRYANGIEWILERKTVRDLANSIRSHAHSLRRVRIILALFTPAVK